MIMFESFIMPDYCFVALAKSEKLLNLTKLIEFLKSWHSIFKYI